MSFNPNDYHINHSRASAAEELTIRISCIEDAIGCLKAVLADKAPCRPRGEIVVMVHDRSVWGKRDKGHCLGTVDFQDLERAKKTAEAMKKALESELAAAQDELKMIAEDLAKHAHD